MEQVQIQCPNCKTVLLVKNTDGSRERVVNCPTCQTPLMVTFSGMGMVGGPQPGPVPQNPQGPQPMPQPSYGQGQPNPSPVQENGTKKNNAWLIALLSALVLALAGVLIWLLVFKDKDKASPTSSDGSSAKTEQVSSSASASASVAPETSASVAPETSSSIAPEEVALDDLIPEINEPISSRSGYTLPHIGNSSYGIGEKLYNELGQSSFVNVRGGMTGNDFSSIRNMDKSTAKDQLKVENSDGYRYQYFFLGSNKNTGRLTGVAVSHACNNPMSECLDFENYVAGSGKFTWVSDGLYRSSTGYYVSPGYSKGRFYVYYYLPNAPKKEAAPRN